MYGTPSAVDPTFQSVAPAEVDYTILGPVSGQACGDLQDYLLASGGRQTWSGPVHPQVLEAARYDALQKNPEADNLMYVGAKIENDGYKQCVTVTGKAYRVERIRAGGGAAGAPSYSPSRAAPPVAPPAPPAPSPSTP
jgi:hypothetical protein